MSSRSVEAGSRENSPEQDGSPEGKRASKKRKVLSCYACRNRKMKCDRVYPVCGRCQKTGRADQCTYDPRLLGDHGDINTFQIDGHNASVTRDNHGTGEHGSASSSFDALHWKARAQERRIEELERQLAAKDNSNPPSQFKNFHPSEPENQEEMMFRGKGFKTQFHGSTSVMSTIAQYRELQAFTHEALTIDHSIMRVKNDFKTFRDRRKAATKQMGERTHGTDTEVFSALPERSVVDVQAALYFQTWETTCRILHEPSFWKEYAAFWERQPGDSSPASFAVMLILVVAITKCISPKDDVFEGDTTADRQKASDLIEVCDIWISRQPRKRLTLRFFQLRCLSLFARRVNCVGLKQDWVTSGDLLRLALASGMHRDPSLLSTGKISVFEKEIKKRLWVTIMELELQSSIESGLQSSLVGWHWDTPAPTNLSDDAFSMDTQELPAGRPIEHFTSASYICVSRQSIPFRLHLMQLLNDPSAKLPYSEVLHHDAQIHELLASLPKWDTTCAIIPTALLTLQLQQFLLLLHKRFAKLAPSNDRFMYSFTACINAAESILRTHNELVSKGKLALNNMRNDVVRVGLVLSKVVYYNCALYGPIRRKAPSSSAAESHFADAQTHFTDLPAIKDRIPEVEVSLAVMPQQPSLARILCTSAVDLLDLAGRIYEQKVMRMGTGYMEFWLLSVAIGMLPSPASSKPTTSIEGIMRETDDIHLRCRKTLDRFQTLAFRVLALQKDPGTSFASSLRTTMATVSPSDVRTPNSADVRAISLGLAAGPSTSNQAAYLVTPVLAAVTSTEPAFKDFNDTFDNLQDMDVDLSGWNFPDFWAFDLGGDF